TNNVSIVSLANQISQLSAQISSYFSLSSQPEPDFSPSSTSVPETPEYEALRAPLNDAALDLLRLINGPKSTLRSFFFTHYDLAALQVALERRFFDHVPLPLDMTGEKVENGQRIVHGASAAEIAEKAGMDEDRTARVLRLLATQRIFEEVDGEKGRFRHTANSALMARDKEWNATAHMQWHLVTERLFIRMDDMFKAASETSTVIERSPYTSDTTHSPFHTRFGVPMYEYYEQNPQKGARFAQAMRGWSQLDRQVAELRDGYSWESLKNGKVVDIGGGTGHVSIALARQFPSLSFIVQDISNHMLSQDQGTAIKDLEGRLTFQKHDFFNPQPVHDANAFLLRQCLHNYNDRDCIKILRGLVPALKQCNPGTPLLINDIIMPESGTTTRFEERHFRHIDLTMLVGFGAKQRTEREFNTLFKEADPRLE
ncbi:MAG: hypothetical protein Q9187_008773, partial [Circinaria calcarea]